MARRPVMRAVAECALAASLPTADVASAGSTRGHRDLTPEEEQDCAGEPD